MISSARSSMPSGPRTRKSQIGSGDRSERIRTYNFPQGRVTDHRIGLTLHQLDFVLEGRASTRSSMRWSPSIRRPSSPPMQEEGHA